MEKWTVKLSNCKNTIREKDINEVLQSLQVFTNATNGTIARKEDIKKCFKTDDIEKVCKEVNNGFFWNW